MAEDTIADVEASGLWPGKVVTEVTPAGPFWEAEPEHQDYLDTTRTGTRATSPARDGSCPGAATRCRVGPAPWPTNGSTRRCTQRGRMRRVPRGGRVVAPPAPLRRLRAHRLLRQLAQPARQRARPPGRPRHRPELRAGRGLVLGLRSEQYYEGPELAPPEHHPLEPAHPGSRRTRARRTGSGTSTDEAPHPGWPAGPVARPDPYPASSVTAASGRSPTRSEVSRARSHRQ